MRNFVNSKKKILTKEEWNGIKEDNLAEGAWRSPMKQAARPINNQHTKNQSIKQKNNN